MLRNTPLREASIGTCIGGGSGPEGSKVGLDLLRRGKGILVSHSDPEMNKEGGK